MILIIQHYYFLIKIFIDIYALYVVQNYTRVVKNIKEASDRAPTHDKIAGFNVTLSGQEGGDIISAFLL